MLHVFTSTSAAARLAAARRFLESRFPVREVVVVGASRGAADDFVRSVARERAATLGLHRFSLTELAARLAADAGGARGRNPGSDAGAQAIAARAIFEAKDALGYFAPVAALPGFPRALTRTLHEARLAGLSPRELAGAGRAAADVGVLLDAVERQLDAAGTDDRAGLLAAASAALAHGSRRVRGLALVLLDLTADSRAEVAFIGALAEAAFEAVATADEGDERAIAHFSALGARIESIPDPAPEPSDLAHLRRYVFTAQQPPRREPAGDVRLFSAPGEGREALEIVRRVLDEAGRGVPFDEMAIFVRAPQQYLGLLEHACARADVPAYFDRGTRRPDPAGRAFLALLSCAAENLSARRFDEYLSLGQVPRLQGDRGAARVWPGDEALGALAPDCEELFDARSHAEETSEANEADPPDSDDDAIMAGTLRSPWKWEELIVESAVVGGRTREDGRARWQRRLDGLAAEYRIRLDEIRRDEPDSPRAARLVRDLRNLGHLRAFALPIVGMLASWPESAFWGEWLDRFGRLAGRTLWRPARVLQLLADLRPMAAIGPVSLDEAHGVLRERLATLDWDPASARYGRLFVGTPHQARGRAFRVVFVPGLAERIVPQRPREDPLLLDVVRARLDAPLMDQQTRSAAERLLLRLAIGSATDRVYLSYPRMDIGETRARVPSFYALDVMRAITGRVPDYRLLAAQAAEEAGATLAWPAPADPDRAVDDLEHDLAVLRRLLDSHDAAGVRGRAHYMLSLNETLRRSVTARWMRGRPAWSSGDGLVRVTPATLPAIAANRLTARPYSLSALQRFSSCPYQFLLASIHRLEPWEEPKALVRLDPLTRGSLFHAIQAEFQRALQAQSALPVTAASLAGAAGILNGVIDRVSNEYAEQLAPAIDRVWRDEIADLRRDLGIWLQKLAGEQTWIPEYFEFSFGLSDAGRDPRSRPEPVLVDGRFRLRGSVDLIERHAASGLLRITDHKTGRNRSRPELIVNGGTVLQPVLYGVAVQEALGLSVVEGRLFYCTTTGGFAEHRIQLDDYARRQGLDVLAIVDRAVEQGFLPAAPAKDACRWCDFRTVCGPREEERTAHKSRERLADLAALRSMR